MKIKGFEDYSIYEDGRVINKHGRIMKCQLNKDGYKRIALWKDSKPKTFFLHRLLAINFIPNPENKYSVDHENRDPLDNSLENLRWATREEQNANRGGIWEYPITKGSLSKNNKNNYRYRWHEDKIPMWKHFKTLELAQAFEIEHLKTYELQIK
tara:strand:+ start:34 stop:495 length:462 start_codon:yes stop_codon:yes gene_type:complete